MNQRQSFTLRQAQGKSPKQAQGKPFKQAQGQSKRNSFTLIELLIVIAILAVLATAVVLILNPAQLVKAGRDSKRLSDLAALNNALAYILVDNSNAFMGTSTVVYVSIADTDSTCSNLGLPTLPSGYSYNCVTTSTLKNTDGTGWVPVNFTNFSASSPLAVLPTDPVNTTTSGNYYTYTPGGSWHLATSMEATKNKLGGGSDKTSKDRGKYTSLYEIGSDLTLLPIEYGDTSLVGYWDFEEGSGSTAYDISGSGNNGTWNGTSTTRYTTGKVGSYSGIFNGSGDYLRGNLIQNSNLDISESVTVSAWINPTQNVSSYKWIAGSSESPSAIDGYMLYWSSDSLRFTINHYSTNKAYSSYVLSNNLNTWVHVVGVYDKALGVIKIYVNGIPGTSDTYSSNINITANSRNIIGSIGNNPSQYYWNGLIDDVRIYNRALSADEISALYSAGNY